MNEKLKELEHIMSNNEYVQFWIPEMGAETYETIYFKDAFEETTTHSAGMEAEQELKKIEACLYELDQIIAWGDEKFDDDSCKYINNLLKSRRDALISQQVIR